MVFAEIIIVTLFIQTRKTTGGTCLYFKDLLNQELTLSNQGDKFELVSVQYKFDQDTNPISLR